MKSIVTNAADISILSLQDSTNNQPAGAGPISATCIVARKGPVGVVNRVTAGTWQAIFGKPLNPGVFGYEGLRQLNDTLKECVAANVIRVVPSSAKMPVLALAATGAMTATNVAYGTTLTIGDTVPFLIHPTDGDPSTNRKVSVARVGTTDRFTLTITDKDDNGDTFTLETHTVSCNPDAKDDLGLSAFITTVLDRDSKYFAAVTPVVPVAAATVATQIAAATETTFTGGTNGTADPTAEDFIAAWDIFRNESIAAGLMFGAGESDTTVLENCINIAEERHDDFFGDVPPTTSPTDAPGWLTTAGFTGRHAKFYHCPFSAADPFTGGRAVWGGSGAAVAATARGDVKMSGIVPGVHYAPAGINRGWLARTKVQPLFTDVYDREACYTARLNPIISSGGRLVIDDCLALSPKENYSRFIWVNRIFDYFDHQFLAMAAALKFEPDGLTQKGLADICKKIGDGLIVSNALVRPRDPAQDGTNPYIITIQQLQIDLWQVTWELCPTGAARRIVGQPKTIK